MTACALGESAKQASENTIRTGGMLAFISGEFGKDLASLSRHFAATANRPFKFYNALVDRKYRLLFSSSFNRRKPGPKGPSAELIAAIVEMKRRNPKFGYFRVAQQISHTFGVNIDQHRAGIGTIVGANSADSLKR